MYYQIKVADALNIKSRENLYTIYEKNNKGGYDWDDYPKDKIPKRFLNKNCYVDRTLGYVSIRIANN
jgi:hypothetical protein